MVSTYLQILLHRAKRSLMGQSGLLSDPSCPLYPPSPALQSATCWPGLGSSTPPPPSWVCWPRMHTVPTWCCWTALGWAWACRQRWVCLLLYLMAAHSLHCTPADRIVFNVVARS